MTNYYALAYDAKTAMRALFPQTPLQKNDHLSAKYDADIWLKREDLSPVRSYKIRGAYNAMRKIITGNQTPPVFVCASAGNHAQGVAFVCRHFDTQGVVFMPVTTPNQKIEKTKIFGESNIEVRLVGDYFDDTLRAAQEYCAAKEALFLAPFDDPNVIEGQATIAVEILEQMASPPDMVVLPVGGGGLAAGVRSVFDLRAPETDLRFVEPAGGASFAAALAARHPVALSKVDSFVDGAAVAKIGSTPFETLSTVDPVHVFSCPENRICASMLEMLNIEGVVLEPAGALTIDALEDLKTEIIGKTVVCVTSGGNFDFERLPEVRERAQKYSGVKKYMILRMPQRPGVLREFLDLLGPDDDIARFEYLKKSARNFGSVLIGIETSDAANFGELFALLDDAGFDYRDITDDETMAEFVI